MNKKSLLIFFGGVAAMVLLCIVFLEYNAYQGRQLIASIGEGIEEGEEVDEFYIMSDAELAAQAQAPADPAPEAPESTASAVKSFDYGGVVPEKKDIFALVAEREAKAAKPKPQTLDSTLVGYEAGRMIIDEEEYEKFLNEEGEEEPVRRATMLSAPVAARIIKTSADYDKFKKEKNTWGKYPAVDFNKQVLILLESKGDLADYIFQITEAKKDGKVYNVQYRVNILGLNTRAQSHTYAVLDKGADKAELKQVL